MEGKGLFTMGNGISIEGEFVQGEIMGYGVKRWPDGSLYTGQFDHGEMHGKGV